MFQFVKQQLTNKESEIINTFIGLIDNMLNRAKAHEAGRSAVR